MPPSAARPGMLSQTDLESLVSAGEIDTVILAITDMQGRLQGKRSRPAHFLDEVAATRRRGLQLPARRRRRHEHRRRLRDVELGARLRRLRDDARPRHAAAASRGRRAPRWCMADLRWHDGTPVVAVAAPDPARASSTGSPSAAAAPSPAPSSSSSSSTTPTRRRGTRATATSSRPTSTTSTTRCSAPPGSEPLLRRIRNGMAGAGLYVESAKGECNLGQHEINFRYDDALRTCRQPRDLQERRQGDRRPGGHGAHLHGQVRRARGQLVPHPPVAARRRRRRGVRRRRRPHGMSPTVRALPRRPARLPARAHAVLRAQRQLLQALRRRHLRADRRRVGHATTAPARCGSSATATLRVENRVPGRRRQPLPRARRADRRRAARHRARARAEPSLRGQRLHVGQAARADDPARGRDLFAGSRRWPARRSATRSSTTT